MKIPRCWTCNQEVPVWKKLAYAVGSMPYSMITTVLGFYFNIFLLEVVIMDPVYVLVILFTGRVWDAISDPVVGYLLSLTKTRFGRLRLWMAVTMVPTGLSYFLVWYVPPLDDHPQYVKFIYYLIFYFALMTFLTCVQVPYASLTMHISNNDKERDSITFYRICLELTGTVIGICIFTAFYLGLVQFSNVQQCEAGQREPDPMIRAAYQWHALTIGILVVICFFITVVSIKEQEEEIGRSKTVGLFQGLKDTFGFKPFFHLSMVFFLTNMAYQFPMGNAALYIKYSVGLGKQYPYVIAVLLVATILWTFFWQLILVKFGKKTALFLALNFTLPILIILLYVNYFPLGIYAVMILLASGITGAYLMPWSMLPDVIDESLLTCGVRREELFYAFFVFSNNLSDGLSLGISTAVYKIAGYNENLCKQPWPIPVTLKLLMTVPTFLLILLSLIFLYFYPITEKTREKTRELLMSRRTSLATDAELSATENLYRSASPSDDDDERPLLHEELPPTESTP